MTIGAIGPATSLVRIVAGVAGNARCTNTFPALARMARQTRDPTVRAGQRKSRSPVIEGFDRLPVSSRVTSLARSAKLPAVGIVALVATGASTRDSTVIAPLAVTTGAIHFRMSAG